MSASGSIYDLGYQGYDGPRHGRLTVARGLLRGSLRSAYGIGRGGRAKVAPFTLTAIALLPAVLAVGISALVAQAGVDDDVSEVSPITHDTYYGITSILVMLFCAAQAPELFGKDQRYRVLPLYFSRTLTRDDYALARFGGLFLAVLIMTLLPHVVLSLGAVLAAPDPLVGFGEEAPEIPRYLAMGIIASGLLAGVAAVIAAWTPRRAYATAAIIAVFIVPPIIVSIVYELAASQLAGYLLFFSVADITSGVAAAIYGSLPDNPAILAANHPDVVYIVVALVGIVGSVLLILRRYRRLSI